MKKNLLLLAALGIIVTLTLLIFTFGERMSLHSFCKDLDAFREVSFSGQVTEKYVDLENHAVRTVIVNGDKTLLLSRDTSSLYNFVSAGDYIEKPLNTDSIHVRRQGHVYNFKIYFGCDD